MKTLKNKFNSTLTTLYIRAKHTTQDAAELLTDTSGQVVLEHTGWAILIVAVIAVVLLFVPQFIQNDLGTAIKAKIMEMFN